MKKTSYNQANVFFWLHGNGNKQAILKSSWYGIKLLKIF